MSTADLDGNRTVETPCCGVPVSLGFSTFLHYGKPKPGDTWCTWNLRCPECDATHTVGLEVRVKYQRAEFSTRYETRGRLVGPPHWRNPAAHSGR